MKDTIVFVHDTFLESAPALPTRWVNWDTEKTVRMYWTVSDDVKDEDGKNLWDEQLLHALSRLRGMRSIVVISRSFSTTFFLFTILVFQFA